MQARVRENVLFSLVSLCLRGGSETPAKAFTFTEDNHNTCLRLTRINKL